MDARAENAMRVVGFFDALIEQRSDLQTVLAQAGRFAEGSVGLAEPGETVGMVATRAGALERRAAPRHALTRTLVSGHTVWISRSPQRAYPLDDVLLERFGLACIAALGSPAASTLRMDDPALLELILGRLASSADRCRALQLLGTTPSTPLTMLAVRGDRAAAAKVMDHLPKAAWRRLAQIDGMTAIATDAPPERTATIPQGTHVGVSRPFRAAAVHEAWQGAVNALRYAADGPADRNLVFQADLGPYELLAAKLRPEDISEVADVQALERLSQNSAGKDVVRTLEILLWVGSLRETARQLHIHHNSVAARVARAEAELGYSITTPPGLTRLTLALALRRLGQNGHLG
ncbi:hypothetical protein ncot_11935 [Nocardioides sp. JQ2195]|uniref:helix-turn-helix domain-containing protein n=1 Tax=Nocardioides sp. JQ2195 TaxID=2592334 RepID=UPI00143EBD9B|nr:helix-turn-helix domain-containing protein [Nocardioides sp. JQ2195]QIX27230.1 hypothetical protein ncot_11935 [Nocardioides sp. JQ2195]